MSDFPVVFLREKKKRARNKVHAPVFGKKEREVKIIYLPVYHLIYNWSFFKIKHRKYEPKSKSELTENIMYGGW